MNRPRPVSLLFLIAAVAFAAALPVAAAPLKLATLVPEGSIWDRALREMGSDWEAATGGRAALRIYPGGVAGDETDIVRKMRIGQLQAAALTVGGLAEIEPAFAALGTPLLIDTYDELFHVLEAVGPELEQRLEAKGFVLLFWAHGGWVHLFSKQPAATLADVKGLKLFAWAGDDARVQLWRRAGFQPVALASTDILTGLQTGLIDAYPTTPLAALSLQWFRETPYMSSLGLAPLVGGVVVSAGTWNRIDAADRQRLLEIAAGYEKRLATEVPAQDDEAIAEMQKRGLTVVEVEDSAGWKQAADDFAASSRGTLVPAEVLDRVIGEIALFRQRREEAKP